MEGKANEKESKKKYIINITTTIEIKCKLRISKLEINLTNYSLCSTEIVLEALATAISQKTTIKFQDWGK